MQDGRIVAELRKQLNAVAERAGWKAEEVRTKASRRFDRLPCHGVCREHEAEIKTGTGACGPVAEFITARLSAPSAAPGGNGPDRAAVRATLLELAGEVAKAESNTDIFGGLGSLDRLRRSHPRRRHDGSL